MEFPRLRFSWATLLTAISIISALILGAVLLILNLDSAQQGKTSADVVSSRQITTAQTASSVDGQGNPTDSTSSFAVGQTVYIAYTISDAGPGTVTIKLYNNGTLVDSRTQQFARRSTYNAYFLFQAPQAGDWEADLYWQQPGAAGNGTLEQKVPFVVGGTPVARPTRRTTINL